MRHNHVGRERTLYDKKKITRRKKNNDELLGFGRPISHVASAHLSDATIAPPAPTARISLDGTACGKRPAFCDNDSPFGVSFGFVSCVSLDRFSVARLAGKVDD